MEPVRLNTAHFACVVMARYAGNPYGGPGRGLYYKKEAGGAGHGGHGEGKTKYSYSKPYGLKNVDHYLGGSTGIVNSYVKAWA